MPQGKDAADFFVLRNAVLCIQIVGKENLPPADAPAVYVANHQSFLVSTTFTNHDMSGADLIMLMHFARLQVPLSAAEWQLLDMQDIFTLFHLDRPFKFVSKTSNFFIPIVGWSMFLTGALSTRIGHPYH